MHKILLPIMMIAMLLTTACTVSDNPSSGGDNNTGAGDHNVRRYSPITANTESNNWINCGCYAADAENIFFSNVENNIQRLYCRNIKSGKLTIVDEESINDLGDKFKYAFIEDGYLYYSQYIDGVNIYNRVKTDLSQKPERRYRENKEMLYAYAFARVRKKVYFNTDDNMENMAYCIKTWDLDTNETETVNIAGDIDQYYGFKVQDNKLFASMPINTGNSHGANIVCFDLTTGKKTELVDFCRANNRATIMDGRLYYYDNKLCSVDLEGKNPQTHITLENIISTNSHDGLIYIMTRNSTTSTKSVYTYKPGEGEARLLADNISTGYAIPQVNAYGDIIFGQSHKTDLNNLSETYYRIEKGNGAIEPLITPGEAAERLDRGIYLQGNTADAYAKLLNMITLNCILEDNATDVTVTWNIEGKTIQGKYDYNGKTSLAYSFGQQGTKDISCSVDYFVNGDKRHLEKSFKIAVFKPYNKEGVTPRTTIEELHSIYPNIEQYDKDEVIALRTKEDNVTNKIFVFNKNSNIIYFYSSTYKTTEANPLANLEKNINDGFPETEGEYQRGILLTSEDSGSLYEPSDLEGIEGITAEDIALIKKWQNNEATETDHPLLLEAAKRLRIMLYADYETMVTIAALPFNNLSRSYSITYSETHNTFVVKEVGSFLKVSQE
ncbi:MAG: hypothetical protein ACI3YQ_03125 [Prevotella sp.]